MLFVTISTIPPVKSAGYSAEADFKTITLSSISEGKISNCMVLRSGSRPGMSTPLRIDLVYRSPNPLT